MKVLHVIPGIASRYGGPTSVIRALCGALAGQSELAIELATTDADGPRQRIDQNDVPKEFPVHVFPRTFSERWKFSRGLGAWLRENARRYDLIHIHALWSYSTDAAANAAQRANIPYVVRPAGMLSKYSFSYRSWQKRAYWSLIGRRTTMQATRFHATSMQEREDIQRVLPSTTVSVIPNGVEDGAWSTPRDPACLRSRCGDVCDGRPIVVFVSRLHPVKGITDLLLPAWRLIKSDAFLAIVGGPDRHAPSYASEIPKAIQRSGLQNRVACLGPCKSEDRWAMFDGADVCVLPSHSENFGIVVAEAMARRCPVVVTESVQSSEHVSRAQAGLVVPRDPSALADAIDQLLSAPERRHKFGECGSAYAQSHFRWPQIADQVHQMYKSCLA